MEDEVVGSAVMTVPDDLASELSDIREQLDRLDAERETLVSRRDALIVSARRGGGSLREIAQLAGIAHTSIKHIVLRDT